MLRNVLERLLWIASANGCFWKCVYETEKKTLLNIVDEEFYSYFSTSLAEISENVCFYFIIAIS